MTAIILKRQHTCWNYARIKLDILFSSKNIVYEEERTSDERM